MPWDDDKGSNNGPWGQNPKGKGPGKPPFPPKDDLDELIRKSQEKITRLFGNKNGGGAGPSVNRIAVMVVGAVLLALWLASGIYMVDTKEQGIVLRFGKYVRTESAGLQYHLPSPIENVIKLTVTDRYRTEVGYRSSGGLSKRPSRREVSLEQGGNEILMLTGDENIIEVTFEVQWQIDDAEKFLFNVANPEETVRNAAESAMREVIGTTPLSEILSEGRTALQLQTKEILQKALDFYDIGIRIEEINMSGVPPKNSISVESITVDEAGNPRNETITTTVDEAFKDVQAAIINKEETINSAMARGNEIIPRARGQAQRLLQEAQGYKEQVVAQAEGESSRFLAVYNEYTKAKDVTRRRMYLETMEQIMAGMDKMVLDTKGNGVVPYLPLNELKKR